MLEFSSTAEERKGKGGVFGASTTIAEVTVFFEKKEGKEQDWWVAAIEQVKQGWGMWMPCSAITCCFHYTVVHFCPRPRSTLAFQEHQVGHCAKQDRGLDECLV